MPRPIPADYAPYYKGYIEAAKGDDAMSALGHATNQFHELFNRLEKTDLSHRYQESKWSVGELLIHLSDSERIFAYRALRFARQDDTPLPGYDHDAFVLNSGAEKYSLQQIKEELAIVRKATISLFQSFGEVQLSRTGTGNGNRITVNALGYVIAGHQLHHISVLYERYGV